MAVFQQAEAYSFACSSHYGCLSVLKFGEDSEYEIQNNFGI
jgi:hypothetical protein